MQRKSIYSRESHDQLIVDSGLSVLLRVRRHWPGTGVTRDKCLLLARDTDSKNGHMNFWALASAVLVDRDRRRNINDLVQCQSNSRYLFSCNREYSSSSSSVSIFAWVCSLLLSTITHFPRSKIRLIMGQGTGGKGRWTLSWCRPGESLGLGTGNSTDRYQLPLPPTPTIPTLAGREAQNLLNDLLWQCRAILPCSCSHSFQAGLFCLQYAPTWPCRIPNGQSDQREFLWPCGRATTPFFCSGHNGRVHRRSKRQPPSPIPPHSIPPAKNLLDTELMSSHSQRNSTCRSPHSVKSSRIPPLRLPVLPPFLIHGDSTGTRLTSSYKNSVAFDILPGTIKSVYNIHNTFGNTGKTSHHPSCQPQTHAPQY